MISQALSRAIRKTFPTVTVARLETIWAWVSRMERGIVCLPDPDLVDPVEIVVALHCARERDYQNCDIAAKQIKSLSAKKKRENYPNSYRGV